MMLNCIKCNTRMKVVIDSEKNKCPNCGTKHYLKQID